MSKYKPVEVYFLCVDDDVRLRELVVGGLGIPSHSPLARARNEGKVTLETVTGIDTTTGLEALAGLKERGVDPTGVYAISDFAYPLQGNFWGEGNSAPGLVAGIKEQWPELYRLDNRLVLMTGDHMEDAAALATANPRFTFDIFGKPLRAINFFNKVAKMVGMHHEVVNAYLLPEEGQG